MLSPSILCAEKTRKGESQLQAGTRNPTVNTKHFLGGGWEEGKGEKQVEEKSGEKKQLS